MYKQRDTDSYDPILTTAEAARLLGVVVSTMQLWLEKGLLASWKTPGGHRRVRLSAVTQLLADRGKSKHEQLTLPVDPEFLPISVQEYPVLSNEAARLASLRTSQLVGSEQEPVFDRLTWLATQVTDCPVALITVLTSQRQLFKSRIGFELSEIPRAWAFCNYTITQDEFLMVTDTMLDVRFVNNPLVTGPSQIRFYGGMSLCDAAGHPLGTLCVIDRESRRLREHEIKALTELAAIATGELQRRPRL